jgi:hypothetical protein
MTKQLVDAKTKDEVIAIFLKHLSAPTSDPSVYRSLALKGGAMLDSVNTNYKLAAPVDKYLSWGLKKLEATERNFGRYFTRQTVLPLDNLDRLVNGVEDWMSSAGISNDIIDSTITKIAKTDTMEQRSTVVFNALENAQVALAEKMRPGDAALAEAVREAFRATGRENAIIKEYFPERFAKGELPSLALVNGETFTFGKEQAIFEYQFLDDVIKLPDTRDIKDLISKYSDNAAIHGSKKAIEIFNNEIGDRWRTAQLAFRASYVIRNIGEMQFRQYFSGHESLFNHPLSYIAMIGADPTGKTWQKWLAKNSRYANDVLGNRLVGKDLELNGAAAESVQNAIDFIGRNHNSNDPRFAFVGKVYEVLGNDSQSYHLALTNTLVRFHSDALIPLVSRALLDNLDQDAFVAALIAGKDEKMAGVLKSLIEGGRNGVESGNFAKLFLRNPVKDKVTKAFDLSPENFIAENVKTYLFDMNSTGSVARAVNNVAGTGEYANSIKQLLADGQAIVDGKKIALPQYKKLGNIADFKDEDFALKRRLSELFPKEKMTDSQVIHAREKRFGPQDKKYLDAATNKFFDIATKIENVVNFAPEYRMAYWDHVGRYVGMVSDEALNKLKLEAEKALAPLTINGKRISLRGHAVLTAIGDELKAREGGKIVSEALSLDTLNSMAARKASEYTKNLFYDAAKQRQYANALRIIFPFAQAQFNTLNKWGQLLKDNPAQFYKLGRAYQALTKPGSSAIYDVTGVKYDDNQGFFYKDEYGQERFRYPLAGTIIGAMVGQNIGASSPLQLTAPVQALNLAAGAVNPMIPGIGPVGQLVYKASGASRAFGPEWDAIRQVVFPFGEPNTLQDFLLPSWLKKSFAFALNDKTSVEAGVKDWASYLASSGDYGDNPLATDTQRTKLFNDARSLSRWTGIYQAFFQSIAPATPSQEVFAKDKDGKLRTQALLYQAWDTIAQKHPGDYWGSVGEFSDTFGAKNILAIIGGSTRAVRGTGDAWSFLNNHGDMADKYATSTGDIVPYFFPGGEAATAYYNWQKVTGRRRQLSTEELSAQAENVVYQMAKSQISEQQAAFGYSDYWYSQKIIELNNQFGGSAPALDTKIGGAAEKIANVGKALQEPAFKESPIYKETKAFYEAYTAEYKFLQQMRTSATPSLGGKTGYGAEVARNLDKYAMQLMVQNKAFSRMYYGVFAGQLKVEG